MTEETEPKDKKMAAAVKKSEPSKAKKAADPVKASLGLLRGRDLTTANLLAERQRERSRERRAG